MIKRMIRNYRLNKLVELNTQRRYIEAYCDQTGDHQGQYFDIIIDIIQQSEKIIKKLKGE